MKNVDIVPAVLPHSFDELEEGLHHLHGISRMVQIDVVSDIFDTHEALPLWEELDFEFDIYIEPLGFVPRALELGASRIIIHARHHSVAAAIDSLQPQRTGDLVTLVGVGLRPTDTVETFAPFAERVDFVQVMGIDHEGKQGEAFDERALDLVGALRAAYPNLFIQVDGAAASHVKVLVAAGANRLIIGSAIIGAENPKAVYNQLYTEANVTQ